ncbi:unnamed protein product [Caenorhabditis auriculariae]|uniref:Peptidase C1A papain C-terminal domain-containing protein n=1 Tax=Caenorhabditis auriculariae TaxID=2777116 RepID=A0A8S1H678_9PELO|nr:unnamed protein product [Caenorhabditis auriculariae]
MLMTNKPSFEFQEISEATPKVNRTQLRVSDLDYRQRGIIGPIKNQGKCGASYAFATVSVVEAMAAKQGRGLNVLSEQHLVDCVPDGCFGGSLEKAFGSVGCSQIAVYIRQIFLTVLSVVLPDFHSPPVTSDGPDWLPR